MKKYCIEVVPDEENVLDLPSFHIIAFRKDERMIGRCPEFGWIAYSLEDSCEDALCEIFISGSRMAELEIIQLFRRGEIDRLYDNCVPVCRGNIRAAEYAERIEALKKSVSIIDSSSYWYPKFRFERHICFDHSEPCLILPEKRNTQADLKVCDRCFPEKHQVRE